MVKTIKLSKVDGGNLFKKIGKAVKNVVNSNAVRSVARLKNPKIRYLTPGEGPHLPTTNYCGPMTNLEEADKYGPTNEVDTICQQHDYDYKRVGDNKHELTRDEKFQLIQSADKRMLERLKELPDSIEKALAQVGISGKSWVESAVGDLLYGGCSCRCGGAQLPFTPVSDMVKVALKPLLGEYEIRELIRMAFEKYKDLPRDYRKELLDDSTLIHQARHNPQILKDRINQYRDNELEAISKEWVDLKATYDLMKHIKGLAPNSKEYKEYLRRGYGKATPEFKQAFERIEKEYNEMEKVYEKRFSKDKMLEMKREAKKRVEDPETLLSKIFNRNLDAPNLGPLPRTPNQNLGPLPRTPNLEPLPPPPVPPKPRREPPRPKREPPPINYDDDEELLRRFNKTISERLIKKNKRELRTGKADKPIYNVFKNKLKPKNDNDLLLKISNKNLPDYDEDTERLSAKELEDNFDIIANYLNLFD